MQEKILITGATGLVGQALTRNLVANGYHVAHLNRKREYGSYVNSFVWNIKNKFIEPGALSFPDYIIHLAGAGVFEKPWTPAYKKEIIESRVKSAELLLEEFHKANHKIKGFISASGISIYGQDTGEIIVDENSPSADDFLAQVVKEWETAADNFSKEGIRTVKIRIGVVLAEYGGALEKMVQPIKMGFGSKLGTGKQYLSFIHVDDLCNIFRFAIENDTVHGVYNATAPFPCTNKTFTEAAAQILKKPLWLPAVPGGVLKAILGKEKAFLAIGGNRVSSRKIEEKGFSFKYPSIQAALENLLK